MSEAGTVTAPEPIRFKPRYRLKEAAAALGISVRTLYRRIEEKKLSIRKDGACSVILGTELERYTNAQ